MNPVIAKRSVTIAGHKTSVSLEGAFWQALQEIAQARGTSVTGLINQVANAPGTASNLSSALRVFVLDYFVSRAKTGSPSREAAASLLKRIRAGSKQVP